MHTSYPYPSGRSTLVDAKTRVNIHVLWNHFDFAGKPSTSCRCPWREDHKPSFSVNADGTLWNDFATGEAGDAVDFFQRASGLPQKDACRKFIDLSGGRCTPAPHAARPRPADAKPKTCPQPAAVVSDQSGFASGVGQFRKVRAAPAKHAPRKLDRHRDYC